MQAGAWARRAAHVGALDGGGHSRGDGRRYLVRAAAGRRSAAFPLLWPWAGAESFQNPAQGRTLCDHQSLLFVVVLISCRQVMRPLMCGSCPAAHWLAGWPAVVSILACHPYWPGRLLPSLSLCPVTAQPNSHAFPKGELALLVPPPIDSYLSRLLSIQTARPLVDIALLIRDFSAPAQHTLVRASFSRFRCLQCHSAHRHLPPLCRTPLFTPHPAVLSPHLRFSNYYFIALRAFFDPFSPPPCPLGSSSAQACCCAGHTPVLYKTIYGPHKKV